MPDGRSIKFLKAIWSYQPPVAGSVAMLSVKDWVTDEWEDYDTDPRAPELPSLRDLYFSPCLFNDARRLRENALKARWLYADLDEVDPHTVRPRPTIAWQTSPGRYQAMWLLDRAVPRRLFEDLNQRLTYYTGADRGGWSVTKVLRVPGSVSNKYRRPFKVRLLWSSSSLVYRVVDLRALLKDVSTSGTGGDWPLIRPPRSMTWEGLRRSRSFPFRVKKLLDTRTVVYGDDRSARLWELENALLSCGLTIEETYVLVKGTAWNKFRGQNREARMLSAEIHRANLNREGEVTRRQASRRAPRRRRKRRHRFNPVRLSDFLTTSHRKPAWLVRGIWSEGAHGLMAGEEKTFKSLLTMDLAVSVASGTLFLNHFEVPKVGPVLIIQEENEPGNVQDRLSRIVNSRRLGPGLNAGQLDFKGADLPVYLLNNPGFAFNSEEDMVELDRMLRDVKPALVVFDPLYLMTPGLDENSAVDMTPILHELTKLKRRHGCGTMIVHHFNKAGAEGSRRLSRRMSGTGVFGRWWQSAIYVEALNDEEAAVRISAQHRGQAPHFGYTITFDLGGEDDDETYDVKVEEGARGARGRAPKGEGISSIAELLSGSGRDKATCRAVADALGITRDAARKRAEREGLRMERKNIKGRVHLLIYNERA